MVDREYTSRSDPNKCIVGTFRRSVVSELFFREKFRTDLSVINYRVTVLVHVGPEFLTSFYEVYTTFLDTSFNVPPYLLPPLIKLQ